MGHDNKDIQDRFFYACGGNYCLPTWGLTRHIQTIETDRQAERKREREREGERERETVGIGNLELLFCHLVKEFCNLCHRQKNSKTSIQRLVEISMQRKISHK
jgi:hypothetical protein